MKREKHTTRLCTQAKHAEKVASSTKSESLRAGYEDIAKELHADCPGHTKNKNKCTCECHKTY